MTRTFMKTAITALAVGALALSASAASAQQYKPTQLKAVGTWGNLSNYQKFEKPFWMETIPQKSGGAITTNIPPQTELGLKGFEVMKLLKLGVFDVVHGVIGYVASEDAVFEGVDLSSQTLDYGQARKVADVYRPILDKAFAKTFNAKLLLLYPFPSQLLWCNQPINKIEDLKGKKIRVYSTTLGDFVEGVGGVSVTIAFAEVVPALQKGVADCGITGTMPAYKAKWGEVVTHIYKMRVGMGVSFAAMNLKTWNSLDKKTQKLLSTESAALENRMWKGNEDLDEMALICNTGKGNCTEGKPYGMKLIEPSAADLKKHQDILRNHVLKKWAQRCSDQCVKDWNATVGKLIGIKAEK